MVWAYWPNSGCRLLLRQFYVMFDASLLSSYPAMASDCPRGDIVGDIEMRRVAAALLELIRPEAPGVIC
jgi:hypothetical protein